MCSEADLPPGSRGECELVDGDLGDLDSDLGSESDLLHVLEKVTVLCFSLLPLFPSLHHACSAWKLEEKKKICVLSVRRQNSLSEKMRFSSLI